MTKHYKDYFWKGGKPQGLSPLLDIDPKIGISYKIPSDPYYKRISIEKYIDNTFSEVIYDSALFDFRHLTSANQTAWQKILITETEQNALCHIFNQDDRLVLMEEYDFENQLCRQCRARTPHGIFISTQKIFYESLNDPFNGVILYDKNGQIVMSKRYHIDSETGDFSDLIDEHWDLSVALSYLINMSPR